MYLFQKMEIYKIIGGFCIMEEKKVVLVTGGASGIGFGTIEYLLEKGKYEVISFSSVAQICLKFEITRFSKMDEQ